MSALPPTRPVGVLHPGTVDVAAFRSDIDVAFRDAGWQAPRWVETSVDDAGVGLAQQGARRGRGPAARVRR